jgi:hypothetical protein
VTQSYNHAHPDSDLFNKKTREITLADYIKKVTQYPCVVVGNEPSVSTDKKVAQWPCVVVGGEPLVSANK